MARIRHVCLFLDGFEHHLLGGLSHKWMMSCRSHSNFSRNRRSGVDCLAVPVKLSLVLTLKSGVDYLHRTVR